MGESSEPRNLEELIDRIESIETASGKVSFDDILDAAGRRSFGPLLLVAGLVTLMPIISGIPGVPTLMAMLTLLVSSQLLLRRRSFWLPAWLRNRSFDNAKLRKGLSWMRRPARWVDRFLHHRLTFLTRGPGIQVTALTCVFISLAMPPMELIPFSVNIAGVALTLFGLAVMARDGLLSLLAFMLTGATLAVILISFL